MLGLDEHHGCQSEGQNNQNNLRNDLLNLFHKTIYRDYK